MSERVAYSRVYWSIIDDEKFASIYDDDRHLACWLRLLIAADGVWPASAQVPAMARRASVQALEDAGLLTRQPGGRYRIAGLDSERERRRLAAIRTPIGTQSGPNRDPEVPEVTGLSRDETRQDEQSRDDALVDAFILVRHRTPTERQRAFLVDYLSVFDQTGPERGSRVILAHPDDPIGALKADLEEHRKSRLEVVTAQEAESRERKRAPSGFRPGTPEYELMQHWAKGDDAA